MRPQTVQDMLEQYPISLESVIDIAKELHIRKIWNERSYISDENVARIMQRFNQINQERANRNNPNYRKKYETSYEQPALFWDNHKKDRTTFVEEDSSEFEQLIKDDYKIFIDTSSLMNYNALNVLNKEVIPYLKKYHKEIYVVESVLKEIAKNAKSSDTKTVKQANAAKFVLSILAKDDLYAIAETDSIEKNFADQELLMCFTNYRMKYNLCLITNDNSHKHGGKLAQAILNLKDDPNVRSKDIVVYSIGGDKYNPTLVKYEQDRDSNFIFHNHAPKRVRL